MSILPKILASLSLSLLSMAACQDAHAQRRQCEGRAPAGDLAAQRIPGANPTRKDPGLYEGPVWIGEALYFSDFTFGPGFPSRVQRLDASGKLTTALPDSGSNGLAADASGALIAATHRYKGLSRFDLATGQRTALAGQYRGHVFNSPNDLVIAADGTIYFTDPAFQRAAAPGGQDATRVYRVAADGAVTVVDDSIANPNGIALAPDGKVLYVNGGGGQGVLRAYDIVDGMPQRGRDLVVGLKVPDGMAVDCSGNLYVTEHTAQRVRVFSPQGKQLASISVDANVTNAAFGGVDRKTLYITGAGAIWQLRLDIAGADGQ